YLDERRLLVKPRLSLVTSFSIFLLLLVVFPTLAHSEQPDQRLFALQQTTPVPNATTIPSVKTNKEWKPVEKDFNDVTMMLVPPGCFMMGSSEEQIDYAFELAKKSYNNSAQREWFDDEKPAHEICFEQPFWIDKYEVTQAQFEQLGGKAVNASFFTGNNLPRENITWFESKAFCEARGARLPTEDEWEYAARGPEGLIFPWGNTFDGTRLNYCDANCEYPFRDKLNDDGYQYTAPVGNYLGEVSWVGALDMSGNVLEWVSSLYQPYPFKTNDGRESTSDTNSFRVVRGGGWYLMAFVLRAAIRNGVTPVNVFNGIGFRCARSFDSEAPPAAPMSTPAAPAIAATLIPAGTRNTVWTPVERDFNGVTMVLVPAGCFKMGGTMPDNNDFHEVCITYPFWIDKYEVTNRQYGSAGTFKGDLRPRDSVNWYEAYQFCSQRNGSRLPTEAEWEYAARGTEASIYPWGDEWDTNNTIWNRSQVEGTENVGSYPRGVSWVGALDMSGNVWEWVNDWWDEHYYLSSVQDNPQGPSSGEYRVLRGGAWLITDPSLVRAVTRSAAIPNGGDTFSTLAAGGFRCARNYE
ncbi:MAG: SUMF1/EgtB/PvdO family nonheme iron enzyme, partial [Anaerolineae bacterium]|nr:SUMF1/EgtB/PvdO family nonheme iron enzyme [Anaerolineae bacterium]